MATGASGTSVFWLMRYAMSFVRRKIESYPQHRLCYVDECEIEEYIHREYGYAPAGVTIEGKFNGRKYKRTNMVAAKCCEKIIAPMIYTSTTDSVLFEHWFEFSLLKLMPKYSVIIMNNASFHRKSRLRELAIQVDCEILFLPYVSSWP